MSPDHLHFKIVEGALYKRKIQPKYPPKSAYTVGGKFSEREYDLIVRAITWETAHIDIEQQKTKGAAGRKFKISGVSYDTNRDQKNFFRKDTPPEIKALAENLSDRTNPLWEKAMQYAVAPKFVYKIRRIQVEGL
jgi:hypothetical protein